eukprot:CAMPEP_0195287930 /NCGR_PEP_ID=MMETSP0707-20130614/4791_1 /TAXON_ID=33640 /ORGANISM="Asterionellopsis glacialis, Strain CCMP134" /LENGTH=812 /DNA_ID=CAMNT_0040347735 /DNA_START=80 /DNA_END=2518 /DNA_ORIENTATION=-
MTSGEVDQLDRHIQDTFGETHRNNDNPPVPNDNNNNGHDGLDNFKRRGSATMSTGRSSDNGSGSVPSSTNRRGTKRFSLAPRDRRRSSGTSSNGSTAKTDYSTRKSMWTKLAAAKQEDIWDDEGGDEDVEEQITFKQVVVGLWETVKMSTMEKLYVIHTHPMILVVTLIAFAILCTAGVLTVLDLARREEEARKDEASDIAIETGNWFSDRLDQAILPLFTLAQFIQQLDIFQDMPERIGVAHANGSLPFLPPKPNKTYTHRNATNSVCQDPNITARFNEIAANIKRDAGMERVLVNLQLAPQAVVCMLYPMVNSEDFDPPMVLNNTAAQGHDLLTDPDRVFIAEATVPSTDVVTAGPLTLKQCANCKATVRQAFIARLSINALTDNQVITVGDIPYKKWGFAVALINWGELIERSDVYERFKVKDMEFKLTRTDIKFDPDTGTEIEKVVTLAESEGFDLDEYVTQELDTTNNIWKMQVGYSDGFVPAWKTGGIVGAVVLALVMSFLVLLILVENRTHYDMLSEMLPLKAIKKIRKGKTVVERFNVATVFFLDIVGYTTMSSGMSAIQVMKTLNEFFSEIDKIANKHKVAKIQTIGDAYMVTGGVPDRCLGPEGATKVALFALETIELVKTFRTAEGAQLFIRCGINSGPLVAGVVGTKRPQYTVFGDTVNAASRMESSSEKMRIQCSDLTYRLLRDSQTHIFDIEERGGIEVKGKGNMHTWFINGAKDVKTVSGGGDVINGEDDGTQHRGSTSNTNGTIENDYSLYDAIDNEHNVSHHHSDNDDFLPEDDSSVEPDESDPPVVPPPVEAQA